MINDFPKYLIKWQEGKTARGQEDNYRLALLPYIRFSISPFVQIELIYFTVYS